MIKLLLPALAAWSGLALLADAAPGVFFSNGAEPASKFGVHEIVLTGNGAAPNPFESVATVTFVPASGGANQKTVCAFYDGGNTWRARLYVSEPGQWTWASHSESDPGLHGKSGAFTARDSALRGMLRPHRSNPRAWMADDGRWFCNISDTAYRLFHAREAPLWQDFVREDTELGITCLRVAALGGWGRTPGAARDDNNTWVWNDPWPGGARPDVTRFDLDKFRNTEERLTWILNWHPDLYLQMILFSFKGYGTEGTGKHWFALPEEARKRTMQYLIARWAAFPNVFWLIVNDMHSDEKFPQNRAFVREVGRFFAANDPWRHLLSTGPNRRAGFAFTSPEDLLWCSYIHIEDAYTLGADEIARHGFDKLPRHVWLGEDYYEQDHGHWTHPRYFYRWLFWSWLLSGGSANYGGRWGPIHPYSQTGRRDLVWRGIDGKTDYTGEALTGLDSVRHIWPYFRDRQIDLARFRPNDARVTDPDGRTGRRRPKLMQRGQEEFLVYHPNAAAEGKAAQLDVSRAARVRIDLTQAQGPFRVEWFRAHDGATQAGPEVPGGAWQDLTAPWTGQDVVLRLLQAH